ncbi:MAG: methylmalonate-semialdehyde dehydrogenase (CoA acylating) [Halobacteriovoraceae bacterium]|nr:methylmalonate-semialdehyde dehydrogenase (CoA acylating) [Halobacteriovoraceae bacterium]|tara:strand:+ start:3948 stop:5423 length:1476 start_codon:yes stop_codon:yes gene_type:complete
MQLDTSQTNHQAQNFIAGKWQKSAGETRPVISPYTGKNCGEVFYINKDDFNSAVDSAKSAQKQWAQTPLKARSAVLFNFRNILLRDQDKISHIVALENGKTINEARAGLMKGIEVLEYALSLQNSDIGGKMEVSRGVFCEYRREPLGVVGSITPFNFPAMVPMWTIPIAIVLGNAYVWKPSEKTPLTSKFVADAFAEAGLPSGILTVAQGEKEVVEMITTHPDIKAVAFVGSTKVAEIVYKSATAHNKRALCLGGAKNHIILLPDADLDVTGMGISDSFTGCAGQRCMAASVLLAVGEVDKHIEKIKERAQSQVLGESMGAIITREQCDFLYQAIEDAVKDGATLILDGRESKKPSDMREGHWIGPTILDNVAPGSVAACSELFGPILSIIRCKNVTEAIEIQNSSVYGNAASVFTSSGPMAEYVAAHAECGMFGVNIGVPVPREPFSFGGVKASKFGHGDITGDHSLDFWTDVKKVTTKWEMQKDSNWMS